MSPELLSTMRSAALGFSLLMALAWVVALRLRFLSLVDAVWALGIGLGAGLIALSSGQDVGRSIFAALLALAWSLRLGIHLSIRLFQHYPVEDARYQSLKASWTRGFLWKSFLLFQLQALIQLLLVYPFIALALDASAFPQALEIFGAALALIAVIGEAMADFQLKRFKAAGNTSGADGVRGKVCDVGLWRYSRHPNYFFEWLIWCGFACCALQAPNGWLAFVCPIVMLFLLLQVTGVKPSEVQSLRSKGEEYRSYQRRTNAFFPWFPRNV